MDFQFELDHIECRHHGRTVVRDLAFRLRRGALACLLGPSGCGKTTALRAIAGFEPVYAGSIRVAGAVVSAPGATLPPERRGIGMVFQDLALFPHLNSADNIGFGLRAQPGAARERRVAELLELVGLAGFGRRYPHELSGGQQQRVALARALAPRPSLVLLDEPFSSLDTELRERLAREVRDILGAEGTTGVLVTHDQQEAFAVGEHVGVMRDGRLLQWDTPFNLYHEPAERYVAEFIGQGRFLLARLRGSDALETPLGTLQSSRAYLWADGTALDVLLRPDDVVHDPAGPLAATVTARAFKGAQTLYTVSIDGVHELLALFPSHLDYRPGSRVRLRIEAEHLVAFPAAARYPAH